MLSNLSVPRQLSSVPAEYGLDVKHWVTSTCILSVEVPRIWKAKERERKGKNCPRVFKKGDRKKERIEIYLQMQTANFVVSYPATARCEVCLIQQSKRDVEIVKHR